MSASVGASSVFVTKLDPCGKCMWSKDFGGGSSDAAGVAVDASGSILVAGAFKGSLAFGSTMLMGTQAGFVAKLDRMGEPLWAESFGPGTSSVTGVAVDPMQNVLVTGYFAGSIDVGTTVLTSTSGATPAGFVAKFEPSNGTPAWAESFGAMPASDETAVGSGIAVDAAGNVLVTGEFSASVDFGCGPLMSASAQGNDPFVAKLDESGACLWSKVLPFTQASGTSIAVDAAKNVVVTGYFTGPDSIGFGSSTIMGAAARNLFVAKLGSDGSYTWGKGFGASGRTQASGVAVDAEGDVVVTGTLGGTADFGGGTLTGAGDDVLVASFEPGGSYRWAKTFGGTTDNLAGGIALDASSHVLIAGGATGAIDFGCGPLMSAAGEGVFVAAFKR